MRQMTYTWREPLTAQIDRVLRDARSEMQATNHQLISEAMANVDALIKAYLQDEFGQGREKARATSPTSLPPSINEWAPGKQVEEPRIGPGREAAAVSVVKQKRGAA